MHIAGLQKMTLLDFPGKVACTVFLQGCNFRCPFCHNSSLLGNAQEPGIPSRELLDFLQKRTGLLDGVCITGGEPTLQPELPQLLHSIRELGFAVKLDTNGSRPEVLKALVQQGLVDYVAMDIKNGPNHYTETAGMHPGLLAAVEESAAFLLSDAVDYELRTTVVDELHDAASIAQMGQWLSRLGQGKKIKRFFMQSYVDRDSVLMPGLHAAKREKMTALADILRPFCECVNIRGIE